jgi:hypothetical protein
VNRPVPSAPPLSAPPGQPRLFALHRREDVTGLSGAGIVAYGVRWPSGRVTTWWAQSKVGVHQVEMWDRMAEVERVHGHGGRTTVVWLSADPDDQLVDTGPLRARWDAYTSTLGVKGLIRYEAAAALVPELLPLIEAYERLAAAHAAQLQDLLNARAEADALRTALEVTAQLVPKPEGQVG